MPSVPSVPSVPTFPAALLRSQVGALRSAALALGLTAVGCSGSKESSLGPDLVHSGDGGFGEGGGGGLGIGIDGDAGAPSLEPPHALGTVILGETHASGGGVVVPFVSASFVPDAAALTECATKVAGCTFAAPPKCTGCGTTEVCTYDASCVARCSKPPICPASCGDDETCALGVNGSPSCRKQEAFDAGPLAFAGTTAPITLFPPYVYDARAGAAPFLPGASIDLQASGAAMAGFEKFAEKFTATTLIQTNPPLGKTSRAAVFGSGSVPLAWVPGQDSIVVTAAGVAGTATCLVSDANGKYELPREVVRSVLGASSSALSLTVTRQRREVRTNERTRGTLSTVKVQPLGWLALVTRSTETASFEGCPDPAATPCGDECVDVLASATHCGSCGHACAANQSCTAGICQAVTVDAGNTCGTPPTLHPHAAIGSYCPFGATGTLTCAGQECCASPSGTTSTCEPTGAPCPVAGSTRWECNQPADCGGGVCCGNVGASVALDSMCGFYRAPSVTESICQASCAAGQLTLCASQAECSPGKTCVPFKSGGRAIQLGACL